MNQNTRAVLVPYVRQESISISNAARVAGRSESTIKTWCIDHAIGRKIGGRWEVSKVALAMYLDGNVPALAAYHLGCRTDEVVAAYFRRFSGALGIPRLSPTPSQSAETTETTKMTKSSEAA